MLRFLLRKVGRRKDAVYQRLARLTSLRYKAPQMMHPATELRLVLRSREQVERALRGEIPIPSIRENYRRR
jgi:hypothetical protein